MADVNSYPDLNERERLVNKFISLGIDGRVDLLLNIYANEKCDLNLTDEQKEITDYIFSGYYPRLIEDAGQSHIEDIEERKHHNERNLLGETLDIMVEDGLVKSHLDMGYLNYTPTSLGRRINESGGWIKHIARKRFKEGQENDKIDIELTIAKWQKKTFWPIIIGSAIGGIMGACSLFLQLSQRTETAAQTESKPNKAKVDKAYISPSKAELYDTAKPEKK